MKGAKQYAHLFETGQYGRLYIVVGSHARGKTFQIYVLPRGKTDMDKDAVEVYGIVSGNPGWTETYGWLHEGPWQDDFYAMVEERKAEIIRRHDENVKRREEADRKEQARIQKLLADY